MAKPELRMVRQTLERALKRRNSIVDDPEVTAFRAFHGRADGLEGLFVDVYARWAVMIRYQGAEIEPSAASAVLDVLREIGVRGVYDKPFVQDRSGGGGPATDVLTNQIPAAGQPIEDVLIVYEPSGRFEVRLFEGFSTGLFLDQRENRLRARELCAGKRQPRVCNLFAYTGAFSIACALGGAEVSTVDVSGRYLEWAKRNFVHNGIDPGAHHFAKMDARAFVEMAARKGWTYDVVIVDPPTFGSADKRRGVPSWSSTRDYGKLLAQVRKIVKKSGFVFASTNTAALCEGEVFAELVKNVLVKGFEQCAPCTKQIDFPDGELCSATKWWRRS